MSSRESRILTFALVFLWLCSSLVLYYLTHKPITSTIALSVLKIFWRLAVAGILVSLCGGVGLRLAPLGDVSPVVRAVLQAALGSGLVALSVLLCGSLVGLNPPGIGVGLLILGGLFQRQIKAWLLQWQALSTLWPHRSRLARLLAVGSSVLLLMALSTALAAPLKWDALVYHLLLPRVYLQMGRIGDLPWLIQSGLPQNAEMLYTLAMALGGAEAATTLGWLLAVLTLFGFVAWLTQYLDERAAWVAGFSLLAGASLWQATAWGYVDWLTLLFGLATLITLQIWRETNSLAILGLSGALVGLALGTKYTAALLAPIGICLILWQAWQERRSILRPVFIFSGATLLLAFPWLLKNILLTGNPVYPLLFPSGAMTPLRLHLYQQSAPPGDPWLDTLLLPLRATMLGVEGGIGYSADIGPLLLGLGALAWLDRKNLQPSQRVLLGSATIVTLLGWFAWALGGQISGFLQQTRLYFPILPAWAALVAYGERGLRRLRLPGVRPGRIVSALIAWILALTLLYGFTETLQNGSLEHDLGLLSEADYLTHNLNGFAPAMQAIAKLPPSAKVLLIYEPRGFYCWPRCSPDETIDRWPRDLDALKSPQAILNQWRSAGYTHILVYQSGVEFLRQDPMRPYPIAVLDALNALLSSLPLIQDFGSHRLYYLATQ